MNNDRRITDPGETAKARRASLEDRMATVEEKLDRLSQVEAKLDRNTALTQNIIDIMETLEAGIKVLGVLGRFAKWATPIVTFGAAVWALMSGKVPVK